MDKKEVLIGTGGIGTGLLVELLGNQTLGREESRLAKLIPQEDRCKLHIISHYIQKFLSKQLDIYLVGAIGSDDQGKVIEKELQDTGFKLDLLKIDSNHASTFSFCFKYEDSSGGNITLTDSASDFVSVEDIKKAEPIFKNNAKGYVLAAPEVKIETRIKLLELATQYKFTRFASFLSGEIKSVIDKGYLKLIDYLSINIDEACAACDIVYSGQTVTKEFVTKIIDKLLQHNPQLKIIITNGKFGSWFWDGKDIGFNQAFLVKAKNTAGAGDSHLSGIIIGTILGLSIKDANTLATLISAQSTLSNDTINKDVSVQSTLKFIDTNHIEIAKEIIEKLQNINGD